MRRTDRPNGTLELSVVVAAEADAPDEEAAAVPAVDTIDDEVSVTLVPPDELAVGCFLMTAYA